MLNKKLWWIALALLFLTASTASASPDLRPTNPPTTVTLAP